MKNIDRSYENAQWQIACDNALADARLEGYEPTSEELSLWNEFVEHKITGDELQERVLNLIRGQSEKMLKVA
ncbi:MAG: antitoxin VbhA family protein [Burkholderiales bacterium]|jgi:hypothetical protein|nr:antitoxin VbhA family protein [Burkholderiales bacterium]